MGRRVLYNSICILKTTIIHITDRRQKRLFSTIILKAFMTTKVIGHQILTRMRPLSLQRHKFKGRWKDKKAIVRPKWNKCTDMGIRKMRRLHQSSLGSKGIRKGTSEARTIQDQDQTREKDLVAKM